MNIIFLRPEQIDTSFIAQLNERQAKHVLTVLRCKEGETIRVGLFNDKLGFGSILQTKPNVKLQLHLSEPPPAPANLSVIMALPRPKVLKRVIEALTSLGIKQMTFVNSARVEKCYWDSDLLENTSWKDGVERGLEQSRDTIWPEIKFKRLFRPFFEDEIARQSRGLLFAHPYAPAWSKKRAGGNPRAVIIGPEGGWVDFETKMFADLGINGFSFGERPLKTETFIPFVVGQLISF